MLNLDVAALGRFFNIRQYKTGSIVMEEGDTKSDHMFILLNGTMGILKNEGGEAPALSSVLNPGAIFGEMGLFAGEPRKSSIVALSEASVAVVDKEKSLDFVKVCPEMALQMLESLCRRLDEAEKNVGGAGKRVAKMAPPTKTVREQLFPEGHRSYPVVMPQEYHECTIESKITCPYCKQKFTIEKQLTARLRGGAPMECDMRIHYSNFDILWINVIVCPNCYFSSLVDYFSNESLVYKTPDFRKEMERIKQGFPINFQAERTLDLVFASHYLALYCAREFRNERQVTAKLWLQLCYLYSDVQDQEMYQYAVRKAFESYERFYSESDMRPDQEQVCCLILSHLSAELGDIERAMRYLSSVRLNREGLPAYKNMAASKIEDLRIKKENKV